MPGMRFGALYRPLLSLTALRSIPVDTFRMTTCAPATVASDESVTVPDNSAPETWDNAGAAVNNRQMTPAQIIEKNIPRSILNGVATRIVFMEYPPRAFSQKFPTTVRGMSKRCQANS